MRTTPDQEPTEQWLPLLDSATTPMALLDASGRCVHANDALCRALGYDRAGLVGYPLDGFTADEVDLRSTTGPGTAERRFRRSDGGTVRMLQCTSPIHGGGSEPGLFLSQFHEIEDRPETGPLWSRVFANAPTGMALLDHDGRWTDVNEAWCELLGYSRREMLEMHSSDVTYAQDHDHAAAALADLAAGRLTTVSRKKRYRHKNGHPIWVLIRTSVVPGADDRPAYLVSQCEELGERGSSDVHLAHLALHDPLTGLANRALLDDRLAHVLADLDRHGGVVAVLVADLDELKPVNDTYGHAAGDRLLMTAADELLNAAGPADTVCRIGGDEFAVVSRVPDVRAAAEFRDRVARRLRAECDTPHGLLRIRASVGLATTTDPATRPNALLHEADRDMYRRKHDMRAVTETTAYCPHCQARNEPPTRPRVGG
ncbi:sensor domain-containing diguanylate cyclase [Saccharopolyspora elongata]|uniref:Diguanylate cyclase n=1 Tax=Saccharopolyspora elongata TaxID=2530387 RepID=A0A4R4ZD03_9PSEU|nr:sensor domain-containing diguanylate cyclase [Saccharopolyspora elongata]TDD55916.1 diguanylate cyclase [Saccharopolyspora elongata]